MITMIKNTTAKAKCTFSLVRFFSFSVPSFLFSPSISIQKQEVSDVIAPSTLGNKAEIKAITNMIAMALLKLPLSAMVGNKSSGAVCIPFCEA